MEKRSLEEVNSAVDEKAEDEFLSGSFDDLEAEIGHARKRLRRFCLIMDATSSMSGCWTQAIEAMHYVAENIFDRARVPVELKVIAYRDHCDGSGILDQSYFSNDRAYLKDYISNIRCYGGGDEPEAIKVGLEAALTEVEGLSRVVLLGDAPDHHEQGQDAIIPALELGKIQAPIFAIYLRLSAKASFEAIAKASGGRAYGFDDFKGGMGDIITTILAQDKLLGIEYIPKTIEGKKIKEELG